MGGIFSGLWQKFSSAVVRTALNSRFFNRTQVIFFGLCAKFYWLFCHNCTLRVHRIVFLWSIFFEENSFQIVFQVFGGNFSGFRQKVSSTVIRTALVSRIFHRNYAIFFGLYAKFYWLVCQNCTLRVQSIVFMGSIFLDKNTFPFVCHFLGGNFSGFRQNFSIRVVRTALVSRFYNLICVIFFGFHANFYWSVCENCTLRVHRIVFMGSIFFEKRHFSNCIAHFRRKFFRVSGKCFPAR